MPSWLVKILLVVYPRIPVRLRRPLKKIFLWSILRGEALVKLRSVQRGKRVEFLGHHIAYLEPYEFLSPGRDQVLVEAKASCVSPGTERAVLMGLPSARREFPYAPGYSVVGTVRAIGKGVTGVAPGDLVAGRMSHATLGIMTTKSLFKVPASVSPEEASFMELGIIVLQGIRKAGIRPGDRVAVIGQGLIGALAARLARVVGADPVIAVASSRRRMMVATKPGGADQFVAVSEEPGALEAIEADVVIEAVGSARAITLGMKAAKPGGTVVLLGSSRDLGRNLDWWNLAQRRRLTIVGAHISDLPSVEASPKRWTYLQEGALFLDLLASKRLTVADLITWRPQPEECNAVYEVLGEGGANHVGIVFQWQAGGEAALA